MRAVFLDRDGVINENRSDHVKSVEEFVFLPGAVTAIRRLAATRFHILVVTNQAAIGRGLISPAELDRIHRKMVSEVAEAGGRIDGIYVCPHRPEDRCDCRKPNPGLFLQAASERRLDLAGSFCIGDKVSDLQAALTAGCRGLMVLTGEGSRQLQEAQSPRFPTFPDLSAAVDHILAGENGVAT